MSTILKALRRLEQEKSTQTDRPLSEAVANTPPPAPRGGFPWLVAAGSVVGAFLLTVGGFWLLRSDPNDAAPVEAVAAAQPEGAAATPAAESELPPPAQRSNADRFRAAQLAAQKRRAERAEAEAAAANSPLPAALASEVEVVERAPRAVESDAEEAEEPITVELARREPPRPGLEAMRPRRSATDPVLAPDAPTVGEIRTAAGRKSLMARPDPIVTPLAETPPPAQPLVPPEPAPEPAPVAEQEPEPEPVAEPEPEPVQVAAAVQSPPPVAPAREVAPAKEDPPPSKAETVRKPPPPPVPRSLPPQVYVARTEWHPIADRRIAVVEYGGTGESVELREGDVIGPLLVAEIEPTGVHFTHDGSDLRRRVGER